jgi:hypothetical protein
MFITSLRAPPRSQLRRITPGVQFGRIESRIERQPRLCQPSIQSVVGTTTEVLRTKNGATVLKKTLESTAKL